MVCVPVAGPWVVASPGQIEYQLACPKRYIVAGLDAELTNRGIDVGFVGKLGSPVNPGITTSTEAVFLGRLAHGRDDAASFRPHIGCVPAQGGGQRTPTAFHPFPPGQPTVRHAVDVKVRAGAVTTRVAHCARTERLVAATHAIGFYGDSPPQAPLIGAIRVQQQIRKGIVRLRVSAGRKLIGTRTVVQLDLLCTPR
jgi:hypothetical protein